MGFVSSQGIGPPRRKRGGMQFRRSVTHVAGHFCYLWSRPLRIIVPPAWRVNTMTANVPAISIGQPCACAVVKKGKQTEKMCKLVDVVAESDARVVRGE